METEPIQKIDLKNKMRDIATTFKQEKLQLLNKVTKAKRMLKKRNMKKSGYNSHGKYHYFELEDIIPHIEEVFDELLLGSYYDFDDDCALLYIYDQETMYEHSWYTPIKTPSMPENKVDTGVHMKAIQSTQTYARRALWIQALDILEPNVIEMDTTEKRNVTPQKKRTPKPKQTQKKTTPQEKHVPADQLIKPVKPEHEEEITPDMVEDILNRTEEILIDADKPFNVENATWNINRLAHGNKQLASACIEALKFRTAKKEGNQDDK